MNRRRIRRLTADGIMHDDLLNASELIYKKCGFVLTSLEKELQSSEYGACTFTLNGMKVIYRASRITPTKTGQFVVIWKRNSKGVTVPFDISDHIDFLIITARSGSSLGQFIFPKTALFDQGIISGNAKDGKRGMRVYPPWDNTTSKQATRTQKWQSEYFLDISNQNSIDLNRAKRLLSI